jgi:cytochrome c-type biogenesis protein CcmH/NrfG
VKATPRNAEAYYQLARALVAARDPVTAVVSLRKALDLNPHHQGAELLLAELMTLTDEKGILQDAEKRSDHSEVKMVRVLAF